MAVFKNEALFIFDHSFNCLQSKIIKFKVLVTREKVCCYGF